MTLEWTSVADSSEGSGIGVYLAKGSRTEEFKNTDFNYYIAEELRLGDSWAQFEMTAPGIGDLTVRMLEWSVTGYDAGTKIATFPKGSWEFVRLIPHDDESRKFAEKRFAESIEGTWSVEDDDS